MKLKIVVAGPKGSGKTLISNCIAGQSDKLTTESYNPTAGVRILEHEVQLNGVHEVIQVELWDASGDQKFESGWKAVLAYTDGVILVYDPDSAGQDQQLSLWFDYFVKRNGLRDEQCLIFAHRTGNSTDKFKPPPLFSRVSAALTGPNSAPDIKSMFQNFLQDIYSIQQRK